MWAAGAADKIITRSNESQAPLGPAAQAVAGVPQLAPEGDLSREAIIAQEPDLLISTSARGESVSPQDLSAVGIDVLYVTGFCAAALEGDARSLTRSTPMSSSTGASSVPRTSLHGRSPTCAGAWPPSRNGLAGSLGLEAHAGDERLKPGSHGAGSWTLDGLARVTVRDDPLAHGRIPLCLAVLEYPPLCENATRIVAAGRRSALLTVNARRQWLPGKGNHCVSVGPPLSRRHDPREPRCRPVLLQPDENALQCFWVICYSYGGTP